MGAYYNEHDPKAAAWLRELIRGGHIAAGEVDERSIVDVRADDLRGFTQCHFFAGIGGWSLALRLAGWPDDRPVWTGSCPCQPFSAAGRRKGGADDRHLWPHWARLIRECRPDTIFGEQVESAIAHGWLDAVCDDLEGEGYACGAACLPAASVGAFHIRQRLWFVAESSRERCEWERLRLRAGESRPSSTEARRGGEADMGNTLGAGLERFSRDGDDSDEPGRVATGTARPTTAPSESGGFWDAVEWLPCRDGKARPIEPGLQPLAHGVPARVGRLRGYGNAIVPQVAAEVIRAFMEIAS